MSDPTARFAELITGDDTEIPLDEAALLIAAHAYPDLDVAAELARLDKIAEGCPPGQLDGLRHHLFEVLGFSGNTGHYDDPRNSFLNEVLQRRLGIPISLAVVTMEVGRRVGVPFEGIGMPGHFLVRHAMTPRVLVDPFAGGRILEDAECETLFRSVYGESAPFDPSMVVPVGKRAILARMLANLRHLYLARGDVWSTGWVLVLRTLIPASSAPEMADVAATEAALGRFEEAAAMLEDLADQLPEEPADRARAEAKLQRSRLN
ncbi:MAG: transglutaminase-like domain-containing protein [Actinomycetota bacterium]|nr:transglutaminase-like domain-containing protein [Actinomycetota bacterium]MDQ3574095.1 transglutaminase-like domain-containing protein [Actinomycetota bacterium]